ncbi:hypothetical protein PIB30_017899 [Stylosanthes scabra]|uniref:LysM domain-containing protein n=1 Tax=Stylosanthes scabra TaxID=79078 RepID=A0ABU6Z7B2_9FABA|nr:hypothetical protein [Stylosanthes scabra]
MENGRWKEENNDDNKVSFYFDSDRDVTPQGQDEEGIGGGACIEHPVSKFDTLAGIAIKYGVEVADIRKMNGLDTDRQIFALKTIYIPLPGRHPPSPSLSYHPAPGSGQGYSNPPSTHAAHHDLFESFHSFRGGKPSDRKLSQAMTSLQGYYGLKPPTNSSQEDTPNRPLHQHRKSRSLVDIIMEEIMEKGDADADEEAAQVRQGGESEKWNDKLIRRRQISEADFSRIPELLLKEDNSSTNVGPPSRTGKRLALRQKVGSRNSLTTDSESTSMMKTSTGDASHTECSSSSSSSPGVRKSFSTPCFQDQDNTSSTSSIWPPSMWTLKPDLQVVPKPTARRNKAALD